VLVPDDPEAVATGACVQAAAVFGGRSFDELAADWGLGQGGVVEPDTNVDAEAVRAAYGAVRDAAS
jgi:hypothetical protein